MRKTKNIMAAVVGNALEIYDNTLYTFFALILGPLFFPHENPVVTLLASFGTLAAGFIGRPLGGIFFSHIGDRLGRKKALILSIFVVTIPTFIIGILPTYHDIGLLAPIVLVSCRFLQGVCVGGELGGAMTFVIEHANIQHKGFYSSFIAVSTYLGSFIATILGTLCLQPFMPSWGWRIPFLFGGVLGISGYFIRRYIQEPQEFVHLQEQGDIARYPLLDVIKHQKSNVLRAFGVAAGVLVPFFMVTSYCNGLLKTEFSFSSLEIMKLSVGLTFLWMSLSPVMGFLADRIGIPVLMKIVSFSLIMVSYPLFALLDQPLLSSKTIIFIQVVISILGVAFAAPCSAYLTSLFPTKQRYTGISVGYTLGSAMLGGTAPLISTALLTWTGDHKAPAYYLTLCALIAFLSVSHFQKQRAANNNLLQKKF